MAPKYKSTGRPLGSLVPPPLSIPPQISGARGMISAALAALMMLLDPLIWGPKNKHLTKNSALELIFGPILFLSLPLLLPP